MYNGLCAIKKRFLCFEVVVYDRDSQTSSAWGTGKQDTGLYRCEHTQQDCENEETFAYK